MRNAAKELATFPERCPLAPENDNATEKVRQLLIGRYRVFFTIRGKKVYVLHVRGSYADDVTEERGEN
ncbi:MAG: type II toxin-antitoxin system RelE/ParE family toxin [Acidobacteria bacterium]|nr:type II toxin-antitoxin system RelE/ParE family toxin [Acidobacteriota bacterium]MBI3658535.1 type II toxin-antitoxin system RelE/ParE family toxin [Acidobacteriota bacterium]